MIIAHDKGRSLLGLAAALILLLNGCAEQPVATDVKVLEKPVPIACTIEWPAKPTPHVANVQLTGRLLEDMVAIWRAAEAELEERIAYEQKLEAAMKKCVKPG